MSAILADVLIKVLTTVFKILNFLIVASIVVSWIGDNRNPIVQMLNQIVEPMYRPIRRFTQKIPGPLDWAPIVLLLVFFAVEQILIGFLAPFAMR